MVGLAPAATSAARPNVNEIRTVIDPFNLLDAFFILRRPAGVRTVDVGRPRRVEASGKYTMTMMIIIIIAVFVSGNIDSRKEDFSIFFFFFRFRR